MSEHQAHKFPDFMLRNLFFAEQYRSDCAGRWEVRTVRPSVKNVNLATQGYVLDGPAAVFVA